MNKFITGPWSLAQLENGAVGHPKNGLNVFSCFHCGGGSTMGYKLAGFNVLGGVDIDSEMISIYKENHNPRYSFSNGIIEFNKLPDEQIPKELFGIDVLDGSPPCSSFSMAGSREDAWGKEKVFREGQVAQRLDDLFFNFIETAKRLKPKIVVAENVKGLIMGSAKGYVKEILAGFDDAGYDTQIFLLNSSKMGVPQRRERVFFIGKRKDLPIERIKLSFSEQEIPLRYALRDSDISDALPIKSDIVMDLWRKCVPGESFSRRHERGSYFNWMRLSPNRASNTMAAGSWDKMMHWKESRTLSTDELRIVQSFPMDYNFLSAKPGYVMGMSVPPFMMWRIAHRISEWLIPVFRE